MSRTDSAYERLVAANPMPDPEQYLATVVELDAALRDLEEVLMDTRTRQEDRKSPSPVWNRGWAVAAAAFAAVLVIAAAFVFMGRSDDGDLVGDDPPSTTAPPTTQAAPPTTDAAATTTTTLASEALFAERVTAIEAMVATRNSGDFDAWYAHFETETPNIFATLVTDDSQLDWQRSYVAANEVWTITGECTPIQTIPNEIICPLTLVNDFMGPAGIYYDVPQLRFQFSGSDLTGVYANSWEIAEDPEVYGLAFDAWLAEAHPEVHASFGPRPVGNEWLPGAADMPTALEYVDEFLAQSNAYPLETGSG